VAQGGAVLVVVGQVGVEPACEPLFGVECQQSQHHLQTASLGAQDGAFGVRVVLVGGDLRGDGRECVRCPGQGCFGVVDRGLGGGDGGVDQYRRGSAVVAASSLPR
jgi:hypothetical protein